MQMGELLGVNENYLNNVYLVLEDTEFNYVDEEAISADLKCPICLSPFVDPAEHTLCGNPFCCRCIEKFEHCPKCKGNLLKEIRPITLRTFLSPLNELKVICPFCSKHVERSGLLAHKNECPKPCILGCGENVALKDEIEHKRTCAMKQVNCAASDVMCTWTGPHLDLESHIEKCPFIPLKPVLKKLLHDTEKLLHDTEKLLRVDERLLRDTEKLLQDNEKLLRVDERLLRDNEKLLHDNERLLRDDEMLLRDNEYFRRRSRCTAMSKNLAYADLHDLDLSYTDLSGANLCNANLSGVNLTGANLCNANLSDANLSGANLCNASITGANSTRANLSGANLSNANFTRANLSNAKFTDANLTCANFSGANVTNIDLPEGIDRSGASVYGLIWDDEKACYATKEPEAARCKFIGQDGFNCRRKTSSGGYCFQHS